MAPCVLHNCWICVVGHIATSWSLPPPPSSRETAAAGAGKHAGQTDAAVEAFLRLWGVIYDSNPPESTRTGKFCINLSFPGAVVTAVNSACTQWLSMAQESRARASATIGCRTLQVASAMRVWHPSFAFGVSCAWRKGTCVWCCADALAL